MRENLFKAKTTIKNEVMALNNIWVEGDLIKSGGKYYIHPRSNKVSVEGELGKIIIMHEVQEDTICQYTGLTDKNGNKIWENDICDRKEKYPEIVKYNEGDFTLDYSYAVGKDYGYNYCNLGFYVCQRKIVEVIGNIFDNPELLEVR